MIYFIAIDNIKPLCQCGCRQFVGKYKGKWNKFVRYHQGVLNRGKRHSLEAKVKMSAKKIGKPIWNKGTKGLSKPNSGSFQKGRVANSRKASIETRQKQSKSQKKRFESVNHQHLSNQRKEEYANGTRKPYKRIPEIREKNKQTMLGHEVTQETRNRISIATKKYYATGNVPWNFNPNADRQYPLTWNNELRTIVKEMDFNRCSNCYVANKILVVHHIDHIKANTFVDNLITLCKSCHAKAHRRNTDYLMKLFCAWVAIREV